ncbi:MAG: AlkZ family DNA glycosylase [Thermotogae bacterium]|nr:AlkZ family DNA glycosylase [Thermotogota bacterium]HQN21090.1 winged helix DNA-binding domain-containing protein [Thermotogota bacterium]HQQ65308.1 winged helix DNA-binding domain-containing protein [Thermotogota bacterium]
MDTLSLKESREVALRNQGLHAPFLTASDALKRVVAVQSQYHESLLISLWARFAEADKNEFERKLWIEKEWIKTWTFRWTLHGFHRDDWPLIQAATGNENHQGILGWFINNRGISPLDLDRLNDRFVQTLSGGPLTREEMDPFVEEVRFVSPAWGMDMKSAAFLGLLACAGTKNGKALFASRYQWIPDLSWPDLDPFEAKTELLRRYLKGYAPATLQDFAYWSALPAKTVLQVYEAIATECIAYSVAGGKSTFVLLKENDPPFLETSDLPACIVLPKFDSLLIGYKNRDRWISEDLSRKIHRPGGHVEAVYLLNGEIRGTWRKKSTGKTVTFQIFPFQEHRKREISKLTERFRALGRFLGYRNSQLRL